MNMTAAGKDATLERFHECASRNYASQANKLGFVYQAVVSLPDEPPYFLAIISSPAKP